MQHPIDGIGHNATITGVPVTLTAIDANNKVYDLGSVYDRRVLRYIQYGMDSPVEGTYKIIRHFAGDDSYGSSAAATAVLVSPATATQTPVVTAAPINAATPNDLMTYMVAGVIAIIIAIAIVGIFATPERIGLLWKLSNYPSFFVCFVCSVLKCGSLSEETKRLPRIYSHLKTHISN